MSWLHAMRQRIKDYVAPDAADQEIQEEIAHHLELETARQIRAGYAPREARARALAKFGNPITIAEAARDERGAPPLVGGMQDLHWAMRSLRRSPGFAALALCTLALGIGATTAAFTVLDTVLIRPLPYRDPGQLVLIREKTDKGITLAPSYPNFDSWRSEARSFSAVISAMNPYGQTVAAGPGARPVHVQAMGVSRHFFSTLGVPIDGRELTESENSVNGALAVLVSYEFWKSELGGRRPFGALLIDDTKVPIVGVLPPGFRFIAPADIYYGHELYPSTMRSAHNYIVAGRLAPGATLARAQAEMTTLSRQLRAAYGTQTQAVDAELTPMREYEVSHYRVLLFVVLAAAALVLLIACTNLLSAQLARGRVREREVVVRAALGASRARLARLLMTESGILVIAGTILGAFLAAGTVQAVRALGGDLMPRLSELRIDGRVLAFASAVAIATMLLVGIYPAFRLANRDSGSVLRSGRGGISVRASVWRTLIGFEIALAMLLSVGSVLLIRTLHNIVNSDTGFESRGVVTATIAPASRDSARFGQLLSEVRALPGVEGAAFASKPPLAWGHGAGPVRRPGDPLDHDWPAMAGFRVISPEYFSVMRQPVLRGRAFTPSDAPGAPGVAIITLGIANKLWPGENPIGKTIATNYLFKDWLTVVGVVAEASSWDQPRGSQNEIYVPLAQHENSLEGQIVVMVRTARDPSSLIPELRDHLRDWLPNSPAQLSTIDEQIAHSAADRRFAMLALTAFGLIALLLAGIGIYGVMWYIVTTRTHEIGIRMALGATASMVRREVIRGAALMATGGVAAGLVGGVFATRYLQSTLYGVSRLDPLVYALGALVALGTAVLAAYVPARRSSRVDPMVALRAE